MRASAICVLLLSIMLSPCCAQLPTDNCFSEASRDADKAIQYCTEAIKSGRLTDYELVHSLNNRGWAYYRKGDYDRAVQDYNQAIHLKPDYAYVLNNRGLVYYRQGDYDRAIQDYDQAIHLKPDYAGAFNNRGLAYESKRDSERAIQDFDQAVKLSPDSAEALYDRGKVYADEAQFDRAIKDYSRALALKPDYAQALKERSNTYMYRHDDDRALKDINRAIELKPSDTDAISSRASIYSDGRDYDRAIRDYSKVLQLRPEDAVALWFRGSVYYEKGDYDGAIRDFTEVIRFQPEVNVENVSEIYQRGLARLYKGDYEGAIRDFNEVADLKLSWGFYHRGLARFFMGEFSAAEVDFRRSGEGPYSDIWMYLAWAKLGDKGKERLQEMAPRISEQLKYWPGAVVQFYLGTLTVDGLLRAAKEDDLTDKNPCNCDERSADLKKKASSHISEGAAYFYLGEDALLRANLQEARRLFERALTMAEKNSEEYHGSVVELSRMQSRKSPLSKK
jgi:tetratricopeptide (TPR) repeat protein